MIYSAPISHRIFYLDSVDKIPESKFPGHYHDWFEIYYLTYGACNYLIDNKSYAIKPGDIVIIPKGIIHKTNYSSSIHSRIVINCAYDLIPESAREVLTQRLIVLKNVENSAEIRNAFKRIVAEYDNTDAFSDDSLKACLNYLLVLIAREAEGADDVKTDFTCVEKAINYIQKNYMNKLTLTETAKHCSVSNEHLSRSFKSHTGLCFNEYLTILRLNKAETIITTHPKTSIADVAFMCGFNDSNYFSNVFKKTYGITPTQKKKSAFAE